jgi:hypothetical protein
MFGSQGASRPLLLPLLLPLLQGGCIWTMGKLLASIP